MFGVCSHVCRTLSYSRNKQRICLRASSIVVDDWATHRFIVQTGYNRISSTKSAAKWRSSVETMHGRSLAGGVGAIDGAAPVHTELVIVGTVIGPQAIGVLHNELLIAIIHVGRVGVLVEGLIEIDQVAYENALEE